MQIVIEGIEPYNELFFDNCFYNSFFPIIRAFHKDELPFFLNENIVYELSQNANEAVIGCRYRQKHSFAELVESLYLGALTKHRSEDVTADIKSAISKGRPVILWVDCYYEPIRLDTYLKEHWPHTLLVYGFDDNEQTFQVIEHKHKENLSYEKQSLSYHDLQEAYRGYLQYFISEGHLTFYEIHELDGQELISGEFGKIEAVKHLSDLYSSQVGDVDKRGLAQLQKFEDTVKHLQEEQYSSATYYSKVVAGLNKIINCKKVEKIRMAKLIDDPSILGTMEEIVNLWVQVRAVVAKTLYTNRMGSHIWPGILEKLSKLVSLEGLIGTDIEVYCKRLQKNDK
ncbi:BtrH N-terminal domain-containing protein [Paenibacillus sp. RRE4]|uniref:BtrH N-terminal domain-containing protein n=1 Tax=Paenibacillus sp. RRE4 TaxID=2962587 RepID=UPI0028827D5D|nr:BtrH N-terminal domain-containing protein [Paenibacillus sp. RRE4]MDT0125300.1 BtrH N-terminal domain-containing protein [Paenibacillus sp. RRE4]